MKKSKFYSLVFFTAMLLCVFFVQGQATTSSIDSILSTGKFSIETILNGTPNEYKFDTIAVVLLVSDTLHYSNYTPTLNSGNYFDKAGAIIWANAFAVRKITIEKKGSHQSGGMMWFNQSDKYYYNTERYLDGKMKPLSKYIKVWISLSQ